MKSKYIVEFCQILRRSELHVFRDKRTNERVTSGMKMHAMWNLRRGHLALGWKPSVMRRERRGVLHLDKYSPPIAICSVGRGEKKGKRKEEKKREKEKEKEEERQRKGKRTSSSLINK